MKTRREDDIDGWHQEFNRVSGLAPEHFCPSDPDYGQELKDRQIAEVLAELAKLDNVLPEIVL